MISSSTALTRLERIKDSLDSSNVDHKVIYQQVQAVLAEANYARRPYIFRFMWLNRAASKREESWFNFPGGRPNISKLHCAPDGVPEMGRCNWPGESMFYCSTENGVPIFEVRAKFKDTIVISSWENKANGTSLFEKRPSTRRPIEVYSLAIGVQRIVDAIDYDSSQRALLLKDDLFKPSTPRVIKEIDTFIGDLFTKTTREIPNLYLLTSSISRSLLDHLYNPKSLVRCDGLMYPSVESEFTGQNIVLKSKFARANLRVCGAAMYHIVGYNQRRSSYSLKPIKGLGTHPYNGSNIWLNVHPKHENERFLISHETEIIPFDKKNLLTFEEPHLKYPNGFIIP